MVKKKRVAYSWKTLNADLRRAKTASEVAWIYSRGREVGVSAYVLRRILRRYAKLAGQESVVRILKGFSE